MGALKGIVILQAVVRGELARKHIIRRLAAMSLLSKPKPHVRKERVLTLFDYLNHGETRHCLGHEECNKPEEARVSEEAAFCNFIPYPDLWHSIFIF